MTLSSLSPTTFYLNLLDPLPTLYRTHLDSEHAIAQAKENTVKGAKTRYVYEVRLIGVTHPQATYTEAGNTIAPKATPATYRDLMAERSEEFT